MAVSPSTRDPRLIRYQIRRHGLKAVITKRYLTEECFRADERLEVAYRRFAELLLRWSRCVSACDLGCGRGFVLEFLAGRRVEVAGIDGSPAVLPLLDPSIRSRVRILDLAVPQHLGKFDLAISTEVAEHLPRRTSRTFVQNIAQAATSKIAFSAAHPGQWGDGHINCRPQSFWISLFQDQGVAVRCRRNRVVPHGT
jgi:2-polyprenyl-3-methyl-5-hydroxy-6-metoxy-1,4-benzoquinol methylase